MKVVETQDLASLRGTHQFVWLDFHIKLLTLNELYIDPDEKAC